MDRALISNDRLPVACRALRLAVVTETYPPEVNGVAMTVGRMVDGLLRHGHRVQLVRPRQGKGDAPASRDNFEEVLQPGLPIPRYRELRMGMPAKGALLRLWKADPPDIVHIVTEGPLGWSALNAAEILEIPVITDFHTNFHAYSRHYGIGWLQKPIMGYLRKFHNRAVRTLVPTRELQQELEGHGYANLKVVARGVDTTLFHPAKRSAELRAAWGADNEDPVVIYVGRLAPEKNVPLVMQAFSGMQAMRPSARLVLVGDGPDRAGLQARHPECVFAGMRTGEDLAAHYASADIFLFPSITETFGNVTVEAMASGLAVVAYDYAAAAEHLRQEVNGMLAEFDNPGEFARLAASLINDRQRIEQFGNHARKTAETLDWERVIEEFEFVLRGLLAERGGRHGSGRVFIGVD